DFVITGKEIVIKEKPRPRKSSATPTEIAPELQQQSVTGRILDEQGNPLQGAAVRIKGSSQETSTDSDGRFTLSNVEPGTVLVVSFVGYESRELTASANLAAISMT